MIMQITRSEENRIAANKLNEINKYYSSQKNLRNPDYRVWWSKLNDLSPYLCDSPHWDVLMDSLFFVKSKIRY